MTAFFVLALLAGLHLRRPRPSVTLTVMTANINSGMGVDAARRAIAKVCADADLVALQEMHLRDARLFIPDRDWAVVQRRGKGLGRCAIMYRRDRFKLWKWQTAILNRAAGFTFPAAGRFFVWAFFRDRYTGRLITLASVHLVPHADNADGSITDMPRGKGLVVPSIDRLVRFARTVRRGWLVIVGDFNINAAADLRHKAASDLHERMHGAGLVETSAVLGGSIPTHGPHDQYDRQFWRIPKGAGVLVEDFVITDGSDHKGYGVRADSYAREGWPGARP